MLLLDVTGSMNLGTRKDDTTPRCQTVREAIGIIVEFLTRHDSQGGQEEDEGGLRTVTFAGGKADDLGDLNPKNLKEKWAKIEWSGGTFIMPGWRKLKAVYDEEFATRRPENRPQLVALVVTDGEAEDSQEFALALESTRTENAFVCVAIIGFGHEHDDTFAAYSRISASNKHVKVLSFDSESDPQKIAKELIKLVE